MINIEYWQYRWKIHGSLRIALLTIHTMVPCDTLTPRALRVTAHAICQWVLVRFELAIFGSQAERSNHYTSVAAYILQWSFISCTVSRIHLTMFMYPVCPRGYILQCSFIPYVCPRGAINNTPRYRSGCY